MPWKGSLIDTVTGVFGNRAAKTWCIPFHWSACRSLGASATTKPSWTALKTGPIEYEGDWNSARTATRSRSAELSAPFRLWGLSSLTDVRADVER